MPKETVAMCSHHADIVEKVTPPSQEKKVLIRK